MNFNKYLIIGGDLRNYHLFNSLNTKNNKVKLHGFNNFKNANPNFLSQNELDFDIANSEIIISAIPLSNGIDQINAPYSDKPINVSSIFKRMTNEQIFFAGRIDSSSVLLAKDYNIRLFDILAREEMSIMNAIPTAEGAIQIAMEQMKTTLFNSNILISGYGRIGKILAKLLKGFSANVFVLGKSFQDTANIEAFGYKNILPSELNFNLPKMDLIINTVPKIIFNQNNLKFVNPKCLIIDLASKPFGVDQEVAKKENLNLIFAPSLPGKVAPVSAAKYIEKTICNILNELET